MKKFRAAVCVAVVFGGGMYGNNALAVEVAEARQYYQQRSLMEPGAVRIARDAYENIITITGRYDVGLNQNSTWDEAAVGKATAKFLKSRAEWFGLRAEEEAVLVPSYTNAFDEQSHMVRFQQSVHGVRVAYHDVVIAMFADGTVQTFNGRLIATPEARPYTLSPAEALAIAAPEYGLRSPVELATYQRDGFTVLLADGRFIVEPIYDPISGSWAWSIEDRYDGDRWIVADKDGSILRADTSKRFAPTTCNLARFSYSRNSSGYATSFRVWTPEGTGTVATEIDQATCESYTIAGVCFWWLKRDEVGSQQIWRVQDDNGTELALPCQLPANFTSNSRNNVRQQSAFWALEQMRYYINQKAWSQVTPFRGSYVEAFLDFPVVDSNGFPSGYYNTFSHRIYLHENNSSQEIFMHEYGHHVSWTYTNSGFACLRTPNGASNLYVSEALEETVANSFAMLAMMADAQDLKPTYNAVNQFVNGQAPAPHTNSASVLSGIHLCDSMDFHFLGRAFEQAFWELLWNTDCTLSGSNCGVSKITPSSLIFQTISFSVITQKLGSAIAYGRANAGMEPSYESLWVNIWFKIVLSDGLNVANFADSVMAHHGIY